MVVKIIERRGAFELERAVNEDLEKTSHTVSDIKYAIYGGEFDTKHSAMIMYEEISCN